MDNSIESFGAEDDLDLREVAGRLWAKRWWIAASVILFTGLFTTAAFLMKPVYRAASVMVAVGSERQGLSGSLSGAIGSLGGLASLAGINIGSNSAETEEALAVLKSREFTEAFIRDKQLMAKLFAGMWDKQANTWKAGVVPPTPAKAYRYFNKAIRSVQQDKKTGLITVQIDWKDPAEAAAWANELVQRLNAEMRARAIDKTNASIGYLEKELNTTSVVATREAINRLIEVQVKQRMLANVTQEFTFRVVDKALPSDKDDPIRPQKVLMIAAGIAVGLAIGIVGVLLVGWLAAPAPKR